MIIFENRASVVLYKYLVSSKIKGLFLLPANICPVVPITFLKSGVPFEFVDINAVTLCLDEESIIERIKSDPDKYAGVLFSHTYGVEYYPVNFFTELKIINPILKIIDDRCLSIPELEESPGESDQIDLILYSTGHSKYADIGYGGFGKLRDDDKPWINLINDYRQQDLDELMVKIKQSIKTKSIFQYNDTNWLDCKKLSINRDDYFEKVYTSIIKSGNKKEKINSVYSTGLDQNIQYPSKFQNWRFNIRVPDKDALLKKIFDRHLFASSHYESLGDGVFSKDHFPVASEVHNNTINLFNDLYFNENKAISVCRIINQHLNKLSEI